MIKKTQFITPVKSTLNFNKRNFNAIPVHKTTISMPNDSFSLSDSDKGLCDDEFMENILNSDEKNQELFNKRIKMAKIRYEIRLNEDAIFAKRVAPIYSTVKDRLFLKTPLRYDQLQQLSKEQLAAIDDSILADILIPFEKKQKKLVPKAMENFDLVKQFSPEDLIIIQNVSYATDMFFKLINGDYKDKKELNNLLNGINHATEAYKEQLR